jgi:hypothetical protein
VHGVRSTLLSGEVAGDVIELLSSAGGGGGDDPRLGRGRARSGRRARSRRGVRAQPKLAEREGQAHFAYFRTSTHTIVDSDPRLRARHGRAWREPPRRRPSWVGGRQQHRRRRGRATPAGQSGPSDLPEPPHASEPPVLAGSAGVVADLASPVTNVVRAASRSLVLALMGLATALLTLGALPARAFRHTILRHSLLAQLPRYREFVLVGGLAIHLGVVASLVVGGL